LAGHLGDGGGNGDANLPRVIDAGGAATGLERCRQFLWVIVAPFPRITLALHPGYYKAC